MDRARDLGHQVGKWTDDQKAADFIAEIGRLWIVRIHLILMQQLLSL
jgi:hypothetical protein